MLCLFPSISSKPKYGLRAHHPGKRAGPLQGVRSVRRSWRSAHQNSQVAVDSMVFLGGFKDLLFSTPKNREMIQFDSYFNQQDFPVLGYT